MATLRGLRLAAQLGEDVTGSKAGLPRLALDDHDSVRPGEPGCRPTSRCRVSVLKRGAADHGTLVPA